MTTLEMLMEAVETKGTYVSNNLRYAIEKGFHNEDNEALIWDENRFDTINDFFNLDDWKILSPNKMTLEEIEKKLGFQVEII